MEFHASGRIRSKVLPPKQTNKKRLNQEKAEADDV
jgi:hypothetical protein